MGTNNPSLMPNYYVDSCGVTYRHFFVMQNLNFSVMCSGIRWLLCNSGGYNRYM